MYETHWHSDVRLTPLDTNDFVTFWIPLRPIADKNDSALEFAQRSHRDMAALFWRDPAGLDFSQRKYRLESTGMLSRFDLGSRVSGRGPRQCPQPLAHVPAGRFLDKHAAAGVGAPENARWCNHHLHQLSFQQHARGAHSWNLFRKAGAAWPGKCMYVWVHVCMQDYIAKCAQTNTGR